MKTNPNLSDMAEEFIIKNIGLAYNIANKVYNRTKSTPTSFEKEDLKNIAAIGLIKAYENYNPSFKNQDGQPVKFSTYAVPKIWGELLRTLRDEGYMIRCGRSEKSLIDKIKKHGLTGFESIEEICLSTGLSEIEAKIAKDAIKLQFVGSLDMQINDEDDGDKPVFLVDAIPSYDNRYQEVLNGTIVEEFLKNLSLHCRKVYQLRNLNLSQKEIGKLMNVSQVQISRIERHIMESARRYGLGLEIDSQKFSESKAG